jgi:dTDP-4-dehydrorhamnose reductase
MRILVTGGAGQVGRALARRGRARGHDVGTPARGDLDITRPAEVDVALSGIPDMVVNAAAYTAVDRAESERDAAFAANRDGAANLAAACRRAEVPLIHLSTDYVFDGESPTPYRENDPVHPLGTYGESKAAGEAAVRERCPAATILRTSWVFGLEGASFPRTILRLAREREVLRVVADQHGCPTFADDLADAVIALAERGVAPELLHFCGGEPTTWHGFAEAIVSGARAWLGPESLRCQRVEPIATADYPTPARRPRNSVLDTSRIRALGIPTPSWRPGLAAFLGAAA